MKILIVGGGGREHAIAWKAAQSPRVQQVYVAPGNAGTALEDKIENVAIAANDLRQLAKFAQEKSIDLTIVGPEAPLVAGIVDLFQEKGLKCFGPTQAAAQLEGSKAFSKDFLARHHIPSAAYRSFSELLPAIAYANQLLSASPKHPIVIKADGLAAGKGVIISADALVIEQTLTNMLSGKTFGEAGNRVVIEEFLHGEEISFMVLADGEHILPLATSQDHKAAYDGDKGPNTGGMGAYSPAPLVDEPLERRIIETVIQPTLRGLAKDGIHYTGFLYAGLMMTLDENGLPSANVLEFNCRLGDPETQSLLMRLKSDLVEHCLAAVEGRLQNQKIQWDHRAALGVVMAAGGYPGHYRKGDPIIGLSDANADDRKVFHAGTALQNDQVVTNGGRVLCVTALGEYVSEAQEQAYLGVEQIHWNDLEYRTDIGYRAVAREFGRRRSTQ